MMNKLSNPICRTLTIAGIKFWAVALVFVLALSCAVDKKDDQKAPVVQIENLSPDVDLLKLQSDFKMWWTYYNNHIDLNNRFLPLDEASNTMNKTTFLKQLNTGNYIPLKVSSNSDVNSYRLLKLDKSADESIARTIRYEASVALHFYSLEGSDFPQFDFTDLEGQQFTNDNTSGKTIFLKTWFINCVACIEEFEELNAFVEKHEDENVLFLSLALDEKEDLETFLLKKPFNYKVIPNQNQFIADVLNFNTYPTHLIINPRGKISKVFTNSTNMIDYFQNHSASVTQP